MGAIQIARVVGFGSKPPLVILESPVHLGTAQGSAVKFDAVFDRGVEPRHATLERRGGGWVIKDCGTAGGTWVDGRRVEGEWPLTAEMEVSLGRNGPKLKIGPVAEFAPVAKSPSAPVAESGPPIPDMPAVRGGGAGRRLGPRGVWIGAGVAAAVALACGVAWQQYQAKKRPTFTQVLDAPAPVLEPDGPLVAEGKTEEQAGGASGTMEIPEELRGAVEEMKNDSYQTALREFWQEGGTRSPYVAAILKNEDLWLAKQAEWIYRLENSDGLAGGSGLDFPGAFVPESFYPDAEILGVPAAPPEVARMVAGAVSSSPAGIANVASLGNFQKRAVRFPKRAELSRRLRAYAAAKEDEPGEPDLTPEGAEQPRGLGLLVGINEFEDPNASLLGCRNDVGAQAKVLATQGIFEPGNIRLLTDVRKGTADYPNKENVVRALKELVKEAKPSDIVYIAFSSHGAMNEEVGDAYLLMADMGELYGAELNEILTKAKARNVLITMDACHTGGMPGLGGSQFANKGARRGPPIPESFYEKLGSARGHVVIRACRADQTTPDLQTLGHGILTTVIVAGLTGDADANRDGIVTLSELRIYVTTAIPKISSAAGDPLEPTFTSGAFGEAGDLPLTVVEATGP